MEAIAEHHGCASRCNLALSNQHQRQRSDEVSVAKLSLSHSPSGEPLVFARSSSRNCVEFQLERKSPPAAAFHSVSNARFRAAGAVGIHRRETRIPKAPDPISPRSIGCGCSTPISVKRTIAPTTQFSCCCCCPSVASEVGTVGERDGTPTFESSSNGPGGGWLHGNCYCCC